MREKFSEFYSPTDREFKRLWSNSHFIFDANVLLNLYMYSEETIDDYWKVFDSIENKIWVPYQAGLEFHRNRPSRIRDQQVLFEQTINSLEKISENAREKLNNNFKNTREHPSIEEKEILKEVKQFFITIVDKIKDKKDEYPDLLQENDIILKKISNYFGGKVGNKFSEKELKEIYDSGEKRYENNVPPGFKDDEKGDIGKYGDLVIWNEILNFAKQDLVESVIFITDDSKEDWWKISSGKTISPHPSLIREFKEETGKEYYQYNSEQFLKFAKSNLVEISEESISETRKVSEKVSTRSFPNKTVAEALRKVQQASEPFNTLNKMNYLENVSENYKSNPALTEALRKVKQVSESFNTLSQRNYLENYKSSHAMTEAVEKARQASEAFENLNQITKLEKLLNKENIENDFDESEEE